MVRKVSSIIERNDTEKQMQYTTAEQLCIIRASGDRQFIDSDNWRLDNENNRIYCVLHNRPDTGSPNQFLNEDPPVSIHIPAVKLIAAENTFEKSEMIARIPTDIVRYSLVSNQSNNPDKPHNFKPGIIELWFK